MTAADALLSAVYATLSADAALTAIVGADGVRDRLISTRKLPCIVVGTLETNDYSTATEPGEEHLLSLEIWSDAGGRRQIHAVAERIYALLHDARLALPGHHLVGLAHQRTESRRQPDTKLHVATLKFRAVTEFAL